jgi:hypothetical protein
MRALCRGNCLRGNDPSPAEGKYVVRNPDQGTAKLHFSALQPNAVWMALKTSFGSFTTVQISRGGVSMNRSTQRVAAFLNARI